MPDDKLITGNRDLCFTLIRADGAAMTSAQAPVMVKGVTITGGR